MQTDTESDWKGEIPELNPEAFYPNDGPGQPGIDECKMPLVVLPTERGGRRKARQDR